MYPLALILLSIPIFFHNLASSSLKNWDEAWYAEIAKQIGESGNFLVMNFNGRVFTDHPPAGYWIISISQSIFGVNELGSRMGSALFGIACVLGVYFLGKKLFTKTAGFCASLAMLSAPWFVLRARSGNLDIFLVTFFVWSIYLAFKANENKKYLPHLSISLALLFLTKTMVPFTILPALLVIFFGNKKIKLKDLVRPISFFFVMTIPWAVANYLAKPDFIHRYFKIGLPGVEAKTSTADNIKLVRDYVHNGIGKWFWPGILSTVLSIATRQKKFLVLVVMLLSLASPFIFSTKGHIWHMIPIYPFLLLLLFGFGDFIGKKILRFRIIVNAGMIIFTLWIFIPQARANWYNFIDIPAYVSDEAILSRASKDFKGDLYIDGQFTPVAAFYSDKIIHGVNVPIEEFFENHDSFLLITYENKLGGLEESHYEIIKKDRDKVLIRSLTN